MKYLVLIALVLALALGVGIISTSGADAALVFHSGFETSDTTEWASVTGSPSVFSIVDTSPTGHNDPDTAWANETNAYDNNLTTGSYSNVPATSWSSYLELTIASGTYDCVRTYINVYTPSTDEIDIDVYDSTWHDVYEGTTDDQSWVVYKFDQARTITKMRIRIYNSDASTQAEGITEADFGKAPHTGDYAMRCNTSGAQAYVGEGTAHGLYTFYLYITTAPSTECIIFGDSGYALQDTNVRLTTDRYLKLYAGGTSKGTTSTQLDTGQWYRVCAGRGGTVGHLWLDGVLEITADAQVYSVRGDVGIITSCTADLYFDDIVGGSASDSDLGDIRVMRSDPAADGTHEDWKNDGGTACNSTTCYTDIDEIPAVTTDYVWFEANGVLNEQTFTGESMSTLGISGNTVNAISTWYYYETDGGGANEYYHIVRDNGTDYSTGVDDPKTPTWVSRYDATMPNGGGTWTEARCDSFEFGMATDDANKDHWLYTTTKMIAYTVVSGCTEDISNTPSTWSINSGSPVATSTDYWANGSEPSWPLTDPDCTFSVTNSSGGSVNITIMATNFTGGVGWTLAGSAGENTVVLKAGVSGAANEGAFVTLTTSPQAFIGSLPDSDTEYWEMMMESATSHTDGAAKSSTVTLSATCT